MHIYCYFVQFLFDGSRNLISGALTLTLLILPIVIIASQEAIKAVPSSFKDAGYAMGATRWQVVKNVVLPQAIPGMMSGIILALSRAVTVLPLQIYTWVSQPQEDFRSIAAAGIIVLLVILLIMNSIAVKIRNKYQQRSEQ